MQGDRKKEFLNASGYPDPTAYNAIKQVTRDERVESKAAFLIHVLKFIVRESGFELIHRIELRDRATGRIFK